jgi:type I restriction enzyme, S subunit
MPAFLEAILLSERGRSYFSRCARGTSESMVKVNREMVENFFFCLPPVEEQEEIVCIIQSLDNRRHCELAYLADLRNLKSALMSVLLTGELRVTPDEAAQ